jgi:aspartate carbamoyltransferase catalytic subunit
VVVVEAHTAKIAHFASIEGLSQAQILAYFRLVDDIIAHPDRYADALRGKVLGVMFFQSSTRTRISFESAMLQLGGSVTGFSSPDTTRCGGFFQETFDDTVSVMAHMADALLLRHSDASALTQALRHTHVPLINAGNGQAAHPSQALLDLYMMYRHFGRLDGLRIGLFGNPNWRSMNSFYHGIAQFSPKQLVFLTPAGQTLSPSNAALLAKNGIPYTFCDSMESLLSAVDVIESVPFYLPNADNPSKMTNRGVPAAYGLTRQRYEAVGRPVLILHIGPRGQEIARCMDDMPCSAYFDQVRFGVDVRKAILLKLFNRLI